MKQSLLIAFFAAYCVYLSIGETSSQKYLALSSSASAVSIPFTENSSTKEKKITFTKDIAQIIFKNCTQCHRSGQVAPFPLLGYEDVRRHSKEIVELTGKRQMPPWKAKHGYGDFIGERRLTDQQIKLIANWVKQGMEQGDEKDMPPIPDYPDGWQMGTPDLIVYMPEALTIPANIPDFFMSFVIPLNLPEDKYVRALDIMPSDRKVVHHTVVYLNSLGTSSKELEKVMNGEMRNISPSSSEITIGGWAPGGRAITYPKGVALKLPKNGDLILETHFRPTGKSEVERTAIGLYFADKKPEKVPIPDMLLGSILIDIPANTKKEIPVEHVLDSDMTIYNISAHAHFICKEVKIHAILPNKKDVPLLWIPDWDFDWQEQYVYEKPVFLPKGTRILGNFKFDNTSDNIRNPNSPPRRVKLGELSNNEMANIIIKRQP